MRATRSGTLFNAFPYPTKISPESIALFIASHTRPGDTVLDCFAGSGTTGLAAILCANPPDRLIEHAKAHRLTVEWGPRRAVLFELGVLGSLVSKVLSSPPDPDEFLQAARQILREVEAELAWMYTTRDPDGNVGSIRYLIWSDMVRCPKCSTSALFWDVAVRRRPAQIGNAFRCRHCRHSAPMHHIPRVSSSEKDAVLGGRQTARARRPVWVYGQTNGRMWNRAVNEADLRVIRRIAALRAPAGVPKTRVPWGDLYRSGYHEGITHLHHFYTKRNLHAFAALWRRAMKAGPELRDALQFWLLSYNSSHATLMTRVVAKAGFDDLVVTSAQPGVLYISGLPVEKNVFEGLRRKLKTIHEAFQITWPHRDLVTVHNRSSLATGLTRGSIDYVFTDPPFGGNIPYAEVSFINEAWLGQVTETQDEVIVSPHQGKSIEDYGQLLARAFTEAHRTLKPRGLMTVVFHSTSAAVWNQLRFASELAGFRILRTSVLDKTQASFKQVTTDGSVQGDPLILLEKGRQPRQRTPGSLQQVLRHLTAEAQASGDPSELTPQRLYSRLVAYYLKRRSPVPIGAKAFYRELAR